MVDAGGKPFEKRVNATHTEASNRVENGKLMKRANNIGSIVSGVLNSLNFKLSMLEGRSKFNSPIFAVAKKNGGIQLVQDFRALNAQTHIDKYSLKDVSKCIGKIGRSGSSIFSTIDLTGVSGRCYSN